MSNPQAVSEDRRKHHRQRCLLVANLVFGDEQLTAGATVRDLHEHGARVRLATILPLPSRLTLIVGRDGDAYDAEVVWKNGTELGVKFLAKLDVTRKSEDPNAVVLRRLWLTMAGRSASSVMTDEAPEAETPDFGLD